MDEKLFRKDVNHKTPGWYLKSRDIELFLTEDGGQHSPVTFRKNTEKPVQPYFISPWQDQRPDLSAIPLLQNLRGDFFCLPFGGNGDPVDGKQYPPHGETAAYRWQLANAEETGDKTVFEFEMNCSVSGAKVVKRIEMQNGTDALYLAHTISNLEGKMPYGHHTIIQMPEENEKMFFSVGRFDFGMTCPGVFASPVNLEYQYLASGEEFTSLEALPTQFKADPVRDYSVLPSPVGYVDLFAMLKKPAGEPAWAAAVYPSRGYPFLLAEKCGGTALHHSLDLQQRALCDAVERQYALYRHRGNLFLFRRRLQTLHRRKYAEQKRLENLRHVHKGFFCNDPPYSGHRGDPGGLRKSRFRRL